MKRTGFLGGAIAALLGLALIVAHSLPAGALPDPAPSPTVPDGPPQASTVIPPQASMAPDFPAQPSVRYVLVRL